MTSRDFKTTGINFATATQATWAQISDYLICLTPVSNHTRFIFKITASIVSSLAGIFHLENY